MRFTRCKIHPYLLPNYAEFSKSVGPKVLTPNFARTNNILVFCNRNNSEDQQIFFMDNQGKQILRTQAMLIGLYETLSKYF